MPRSSQTLSMVFSIRLFGHDAPAVTPTTTGLFWSRRLLYSEVISDFCSRSKWMIFSMDSIHLASLMKNVGSSSWPISTRWVVFELLYPPTTRSMSIGTLSISKSASWRSWVAPQMVSNIWQFSADPSLFVMALEILC